MASALLVDQMLIHVPPDATTHRGFRRWATSDSFPERGRITFINQQLLIDMSPEEIETHNKVKTAVGSAVYALTDSIDCGTFYGDRVLLTHRKAGISTEPDGLFVSWKTFKAGKVELVPREGYREQFMELQGTPDWVLEVVSQSSVRKDCVLLRDAYHAAGIPEYWLIDASGEEIDFLLLTHRKRGYAPVAPIKGWRYSRVFHRQVRLDRRRDRIGMWKYRLRFKA
jgi:Uma2 family endonuclease